MGYQKVLEFYPTLKPQDFPNLDGHQESEILEMWGLFGLLDAQDANSTLKPQDFPNLDGHQESMILEMWSFRNAS